MELQCAVVMRSLRQRTGAVVHLSVGKLAIQLHPARIALTDVIQRDLSACSDVRYKNMRRSTAFETTIT